LNDREDGSPTTRGFHYHVSDEQLFTFAARTPEQRLRWLDEMREIMADMAPPEAQHWWKRFREGT
jgi:hypothetical protein